MTFGPPAAAGGAWPAGGLHREVAIAAPARAAVRWDRADLIRRVVDALEVAHRMVRLVGDAGSTSGELANGSGAHLGEKVVAETALLLLCVEPIRDSNGHVRERFETVAELLGPLARHPDRLAAICLDPGMACDHAVAHILLSRLGYLDRDVDHLLSATLAGVDFGPERLPHRRLEQAWLARLRRQDEISRRLDSRLVADSMLGRPLDALGSSRLDLYAFTHAVMYASDLGERRLTLRRPRAAVAADADAALAYSLDAGDFDLAAELLLTWPLLALAWSPAAAFAFRILTEVEDARGFLPGSTFDDARYEKLEGEERTRYMLRTCYHTIYVMGFLCAVALRPGCTPPAAVPPARRSAGAGAAILPLLHADETARCWREPFTALGRRQQDALAPLLLAILLRRARAAGDLNLIRTALELALAHDLAHGPAPRQAAALLRRSQALRL